MSVVCFVGGLLIEVYVILLLLWFIRIFLKISLISDHELLAILSRGYVYSRFIFFDVLLIVGVDIIPLTSSLGPSHSSKAVLGISSGLIFN